MPGHDRTRIVGQTPKQLEEFSCGICHDVLNHPLATQCCRQSYCKDCIEEWLKGHNRCPNDHKPLTRAQLLEVPRLLVNVIDDMQIKCVFSGKGCPSVHSISEDSAHTLKCDFNECTECGHRGDKTGHNCIKYLLQQNDILGKQIDKLKAENCGSKNCKSKSSDNSNETAGRLCKSSFIFAVCSAYLAVGYSVEVNHNFDQEWEKRLIKICKEVIVDFDVSTRTEQDFITTIKDKIDKLPNDLIGLYHWNVSLSPSNNQGQSGDKSKLLQLAFSKLTIVITADYYGPSE